MAEQQWEYCELGLEDWKKHKLLGGKTGWSYGCYITYYTPTGDELTHTLSKLDKPLPYNPFVKAMGLLGAAGWELVSIQHANTGGETSAGGWIRWSNRVAYFKRPSVPGRAVNEPQLSV